MASEKKLTAFISHSSKDSAFIESHLIPQIESAGIRAWYSTLDIHTSEEWFEKIKNALDECDFLIVVASHHSANSEWVKAEVDWALEHRRGRVVPVRIDSVDPGEIDLRLRRIQQVDLGESSPEAFIQILEDHSAGKAGIPHALRDTHGPSRPFVTRVSWQPIALAILLIGVTLFVFRDKFINPSLQQDSSPSDRPPIHISEEALLEIVRKYSITLAALQHFFSTLEEDEVPPEELDSMLQEFAKRYKTLEIEIQEIPTENDPGAAEFKAKALNVLEEEGDLLKVEALLDEFKSRFPDPEVLGLSFEASEGVVTAPFEILPNGTVVQAVTTASNPALGGRALYTFKVEAAGDYFVTALVRCDDDEANSFFVNIDAEPTIQNQWNIPSFSNINKSNLLIRVVYWQVPTPPLTPGKIWPLSAGNHDLIFRGREAGAVLGRITISKVPSRLAAPSSPSFEAVVPTGP